MRELSLHILDIVQNSVSAGAALVETAVTADTAANLLTVTVKDNGRGMSREFLKTVTDPFSTTRTTRKVGMGTALFKMAAETAGGSFRIDSEEGKGTCVTAEFALNHIDRAPLGDYADTVLALVCDGRETPEFTFLYSVDGREFLFDTREIKRVLDGVPLDNPEVREYLAEYLKTNFLEVDKGVVL